MKNMSSFKGKRNKKMWVIVLSVTLLLVVLVCAIIPPSFGKPKPYLDENGNTLSGSISEKTFLDINGTKLGMFIMGKDETKPVLLFLSGGPGIPEYLLEYEYPTGLSNEFVVCYLEYRGTSLSYSADVSQETMTTEQYLSDVVAVTNYLRERFDQDKVYLMGHSFGTSIGLQAASQHPELYHAYVAMAQMVDQSQSEKDAYTYMLNQYQLQGNSKMVKKFEQYPILTSDDAYQEYTSSSLRDNAMHDLGVGSTHTMNSVISGIFLPSLRCPVYTPTERINIWRSKAFAANSPVEIDCNYFMALQAAPSIQIPIYFLAGQYDYTCCYSLQKAYYQAVEAPVKGFYTFDESAHSPLFEEPEKALEILTQDVLRGTIALSD